MSQKFQIENDISPEHLQAIGLIIATWSALEQIFFYELALLVAGPKITQLQDILPALILGTGMKPNTMLGLMRGVIEAKFKGEELMMFDKIRNKLNHLSDRRDLIAHSVWAPGTRAGTIRTIKSKSVNKLSSEPHEFTVQEFQDIAARMRDAGNELISFLEITVGVKLDPQALYELTQ